jgi:hypothetical protein
MGWAMYILDDVFKNWHPVTLNALLHFGGKKTPRASQGASSA